MAWRWAQHRNPLQGEKGKARSLSLPPATFLFLSFLFLGRSGFMRLLLGVLEEGLG